MMMMMMMMMMTMEALVEAQELGTMGGTSGTQRACTARTVSGFGHIAEVTGNRKRKTKRRKWR
jgi:hypothetical protein